MKHIHKRYSIFGGRTEHQRRIKAAQRTLSLCLLQKQKLRRLEVQLRAKGLKPGFLLLELRQATQRRYTQARRALARVKRARPQMY